MNRRTTRASRHRQRFRRSWRGSLAMTVLQQARSFVDPTTNSRVVRDFELPEYREWIRARPVSGSRLLANFLQEWTHRWCFHSAVGWKLALLRMRAACRTY